MSSFEITSHTLVYPASPLRELPAIRNLNGLLDPDVDAASSLVYDDGTTQEVVFAEPVPNPKVKFGNFPQARASLGNYAPSAKPAKIARVSSQNSARFTNSGSTVDRPVQSQRVLIMPTTLPPPPPVAAVPSIASRRVRASGSIARARTTSVDERAPPIAQSASPLTSPSEHEADSASRNAPSQTQSPPLLYVPTPPPLLSRLQLANNNAQESVVTINPEPAVLRRSIKRPATQETVTSEVPPPRFSDGSFATAEDFVPPSAGDTLAKEVKVEEKQPSQQTVSKVVVARKFKV